MTTRYARLPNGNEVAYRTHADREGPQFVFIPGGTTPIEVLDDDPLMDRFLQTLGRYGSVHALERPGIGASDPLDPDLDYSEQLVRAVVAVLDDLRVQSAWLVAAAGHAAAMVRTIARHPARVAGACLVNPVRERAPVDRVDQVLDRDDASFDDVMRLYAPSRWDDPAYRDWIDRAGRLGASATAAKAFYQAAMGAGEAFVRAPELVTTDQPVLVIHRRGNQRVSREDADWWAAKFAGGRVLEIEGVDVAIEAPDSAEIAHIVGSSATGTRLPPVATRPLVALLFADLVASTARAGAAGDAPWRVLLDRFESATTAAIEREAGRVVKHTGDGTLATLPAPSRALHAAVQLRRAAVALGLEIRIGVHVGEVETRGEDIGGLAVHLTSRVMSHADAGQILMTSTVVESMLGSHWSTSPLGPVALKGIDGDWRLYALD